MGFLEDFLKPLKNPKICGKILLTSIVLASVAAAVDMKVHRSYVSTSNPTNQVVTPYQTETNSSYSPNK